MSSASSDTLEINCGEQNILKNSIVVFVTLCQWSSSMQIKSLDCCQTSHSQLNANSNGCSEALLLQSALFLCARMFSVIEGRWNQSRLNFHVEEKMNETEEGLWSEKGQGRIIKTTFCSIWVRSLGLIFSRQGVIPPLLFSAPPASRKGLRNWRLLSRNKLYLAPVTKHTLV